MSERRMTWLSQSFDEEYEKVPQWDVNGLIMKAFESPEQTKQPDYQWKCVCSATTAMFCPASCLVGNKFLMVFLLRQNSFKVSSTVGEAVCSLVWQMIPSPKAIWWNNYINLKLPEVETFSWETFLLCKLKIHWQRVLLKMMVVQKIKPPKRETTWWSVFSFDLQQLHYDKWCLGIIVIASCCWCYSIWCIRYLMKPAMSREKLRSILRLWKKLKYKPASK